MVCRILAIGIEQGFSLSNICIDPWDLLKIQILAPQLWYVALEPVFLTSSPFMWCCWSVHYTLTREARAPCGLDPTEWLSIRAEGKLESEPTPFFLWTPETPLPRTYHYRNASPRSWSGILPWSVFLLTSWASREGVWMFHTCRATCSSG